MQNRYPGFDLHQSVSEERYSEQNKLLAEALELSRVQVQELSKQLKDCNMELLRYKLKTIQNECSQSSTLDFMDENVKKVARVEFEKINDAIANLQQLLVTLNENDHTVSQSSSAPLSKRNSLNHCVSTMKSILNNLTVADMGVDVVTHNTHSSYNSLNETVVDELPPSPNPANSNDMINATFDVDRQQVNEATSAVNHSLSSKPTDDESCNVTLVDEIKSTKMDIMKDLLDTPMPSTQSTTSSRPQRSTTRKVASYKEPSIRSKLRRGDDHTDSFPEEKDDPNFLFKKMSKKSTRSRSPSKSNTNKQIRKRKVIANR